MYKFSPGDRVIGSENKREIMVLEYHPLTLAANKISISTHDEKETVLCEWFEGARYRQAWFKERELRLITSPAV